jgi:demethylmenaquinone methyltransferase/2-methoxy-6-polyprenyl-1,4-benzoquinol methylase
MSKAVQEMFGSIAGRYDAANRIMSARSDVRWRRRALNVIRGHPEVVLDLACGTFDLGLEALALNKARIVHGCDFSLPMLAAGSDKRRGQAVTATAADAMRLPFADRSFDLVVIAYGWRNFDQPTAALLEMARVLKPDGQLLILEFFRPTWWWPRLFYATFGRFVFPLLGGLVTRHPRAYRYLFDSVRSFMTVDEAERLLAVSGFGKIRRISCFGGISHGLTCDRTF